MIWDPEQYLKFVDARQRPAVDLVARLDGLTPRRIVDLGCGAGNITALLHERWPLAQICGVDRDQAMLRKAAATAPEISWQHAEIADWQATAAVDLIFSNAALHWLDDHQRLFVRLLGELAADGVLAVQMPANFAQPAHRTLRELAAETRWQRVLAEARLGSVLAADEYHCLLSAHCHEVDVWETTYWQQLRGDDAVVEWMKGTTLRPYLNRLDAVAAVDFLAAYRQRVAEAYPVRADGSVLFPFRRLFLVARR